VQVSPRERRKTRHGVKNSAMVQSSNLSKRLRELCKLTGFLCVRTKRLSESGSAGRAAPGSGPDGCVGRARSAERCREAAQG